MALTFFYALTKLPIAEAIAISFVASLIALYLARIMLGETIRQQAILASILGFAGTLVIIAGKIGQADFDRDTALGLVAILSSAMLYAYSFILIRRQSQVAGPAEIATFHSGVSVLIPGLAIPFLFEMPETAVLRDLGAAAVLTVIGAMGLAGLCPRRGAGAGAARIFGRSMGILVRLAVLRRRADAAYRCGNRNHHRGMLAGDTRATPTTADRAGLTMQSSRRPCAAREEVAASRRCSPAQPVTRRRTLDFFGIPAQVRGTFAAPPIRRVTALKRKDQRAHDPGRQGHARARSTLTVNGKDYAYYSFAKAAEKIGDVSKLPFSLKVLLENMLRFEDGGFTVSTDDAQAIADWQKNPATGKEIQYRPARVLLQDFTGVPCVVDLAAMRDAISKLGGDTAKINPQVPVNLVIDHSVMVDEFGHPKAFEKNVELEYARNAERYDFLKWGSKSFENFSAVPPGTGICHQVNLEYIGKGVWSTNDPDGNAVAYPDTCVGTDSHTTMINGLGVLGWGVGGIEAEAAMLGQPISMLIPEVVGFKLTGAMAEGVTATDLVLTVVRCCAKGVVGKFVEFYGEGLDVLSLADRATIANMAPEYGATCGFFPVDDGRPRVPAPSPAATRRPSRWSRPIAKRAGHVARRRRRRTPVFTDTLELDLGDGRAEPRRPQASAGPRRLSTPVDERKHATSKDLPDKARRAPSGVGRRTTTSATATS